MAYDATTIAIEDAKKVEWATRLQRDVSNLVSAVARVRASKAIWDDRPNWASDGHDMQLDNGNTSHINCSAVEAVNAVTAIGNIVTTYDSNEVNLTPLMNV